MAVITNDDYNLYYSKHIGNQTVYEDFAKTYTVTYTDDQLIAKYHGPWGKVKPFKSVWTYGFEIEPNYYVVGINFTRREGNYGEITLTAQHSDTNIGELSGLLQTSDPEWSMKMNKIEFPYPDHPKFPQGMIEVQGPSVYAGTVPVEMDANLIWQLFINSPLNVQADKMFKLDTSEDSSSLIKMPEVFDDWVTEWNRGRENFISYCPVISKATTYHSTPNLSSMAALSDFDKLGGIDVPTGAPGGWTDVAKKWLKTGDDITYNGSTFTRQEEWTGAYNWPDFIYNPAPFKDEDENANAANSEES